MLNLDMSVFCQDTLTNEVVARCFARGSDQTYLQWRLHAWGWTVGVALTALFVALVVGSIIGTLRTLPDSPWLVRFGNAWVELFRNVPLLVQVFIWYFVLPKMIPPMPGYCLMPCPSSMGMKDGLEFLAWIVARPEETTNA